MFFPQVEGSGTLAQSKNPKIARNDDVFDIEDGLSQ